MNCYPIKTIAKIIKKEKIEKIKTMIDNTKEDFKQYIKSYINGNFTNMDEDIKLTIVEALLKPYIQKMVSFFHFCDCVLLNYNVEYPDYSQQMNMNLIISIFNEKANLKSLSETNVELLFSYEDNNYISKQHKVKLTLDKIKNDYKLPLNNSFQLTEDIEVISENDGIRIYKNGVCSSTIKQNYGEKRFHKINNETFVILTKESFDRTLVEIFSLKYNEIIYSSRYFFICYIFNLDSDTFEITSNSFTDINKIEEKKVIRVSSNRLDRASREFLDAIRIPNTNYYAILREQVIDLYNKDDSELVKSIIIESNVFNRFYIDNDSRIFLGGFKIGFFDIINWKVTVIKDDKIKRFQGYLAGVESELNYSDIVVTYFNNLVCIKHLKQTERCTYDDVPDRIIADDTDVCLFKFNAENNTADLIEIKKGLNPKSLRLNDKNEIVITCLNGIQIYNVE
jgi:hypothetical protein